MTSLAQEVFVGAAGSPAGPVLAGLLGAQAGEAVLRFAFGEAQRRGVAVRVVIAGSPAAAGSDVFLFDLVERWAEKYPGVSVATSVRRGVDAAVVLSAATRGCGLAFMPKPADANTAAVLQALSRRAHCPLVLVGATTGGHNQSPARGHHLIAGPGSLAA